MGTGDEIGNKGQPFFLQRAHRRRDPDRMIIIGKIFFPGSDQQFNVLQARIFQRKAVPSGKPPEKAPK